jgi:hypothetical protein
MLRQKIALPGLVQVVGRDAKLRATSGSVSGSRYSPGVGVATGPGVGATGEGVAIGVLSGVGAGVGEGVLTGVAEGDGLGLALAAACLVWAWCFLVTPLPAFSRVVPAFDNPLPTVLSVA